MNLQSPAEAFECMEDVQQQYVNLLRRYREFTGNILRAEERVADRHFDISIEQDEYDSDFYHVGFCGKKYGIKFDTSVMDNRLAGRITFHLLLAPKKWKPVYDVHFKESGELVGVFTHDESVPYTNNVGHCYGILMEWLTNHVLIRVPPIDEE